MAYYKKTEGVIYRCPMCLFTLNDVTVFEDADGIYRCLKCGFHGTFEEMTEHYYNFRARYSMVGKRLTLEEQRKM